MAKLGFDVMKRGTIQIVKNSQKWLKTIPDNTR